MVELEELRGRRVGGGAVVLDDGAFLLRRPASGHLSARS